MTRVRAAAVAVIVLLVLSGLILKGRQTPPDSKGGTALVIGYRGNTPIPVLSEKDRAHIQAAVDQGDTIYLVPVNGANPTLKGSFPTACSLKTCDDFRHDKITAVEAALLNNPATQPEASTLNAVVVAADAMKSLTGPKQILVIDSGLDTAGAMNLQDLSVIDQPADSSAEWLISHGFLRNLQGVQVIADRIGDVADKQPSLGPEASKLQTLWTTLLTKAGASPDISGGTTPDSARRTKPVPLPPVSVANRPTPPAPPSCKSEQFKEQPLTFQNNKAGLIDENTAKAFLTPYAENLKANGWTVTLTGTTSEKETDPTNPLSHARAETVNRVLVELGVNPSKILTNGVGINWDGYRPPHNLSEEYAMKLVLYNPVCPGH